MFNLKTKIFLAAILIFGGIIAANAQAPGSAIHANIPVTFVVDDKEFPAGEYIIKRQPSSVSSRYALMLQGEGQAIFFNTVGSTSGQAAGETELVFDQVGDRYFLSQIHYKGDTTFNELPKTKAEKRYIAQNSVRKVVVPNTGF